MNKQNIERRYYACGITKREDDQKHIIEGVPIVFGKETDMGWCREVIESGALDKTDLKDVPLLTNHDTDQLPLARSRNNNANSTMQLSVQSDGLHFRADLDTEHNSRAEELDSAVSRQDVTGMSFAFTVDGYEWEDIESDSPLRRIKSISRVYEISAVTYPAYPQTEIYARGLDSLHASLDSEKEALESARRSKKMRDEIKKKVEEMRCRKD